jgi:hypothetical protein
MYLKQRSSLKLLSDSQLLLFRLSYQGFIIRKIEISFNLISLLLIIYSSNTYQLSLITYLMSPFLVSFPILILIVSSADLSDNPIAASKCEGLLIFVLHADLLILKYHDNQASSSTLCF